MARRRTWWYTDGNLARCSRSGSTSHTRIYHGFKNLVLRRADYQTKRVDFHIVHLRRLYIVQLGSNRLRHAHMKRMRRFNFELEVSVFEDSGAEVEKLGRLSIRLATCSDHERCRRGWLVPCS